MNVRQIQLDDEYDSLSMWWRKRGLEPPPKIVLDGAQGVVVKASSVELCAGWLYLVNDGHLGMIEWIVSNPTVIDSRSMKAAVTMLYDFLENLAVELGCSVLFTTTPAKHSLERFLTNHQWISCKGDPHTHLVKPIKRNAHETAA